MKSHKQDILWSSAFSLVVLILLLWLHSAAFSCYAIASGFLLIGILYIYAIELVILVLGVDAIMRQKQRDKLDR